MSTIQSLAKVFAFSVLIACVWISPSFAAEETNTGNGLTAVGAPLGFHGFDPVAFIQIGNRQAGSAVHAAVHDGVAYYFANSANQKAFKRNPGKFLPQNGGYCTFGVSVGKKFDGDPRFAAIEQGKLYVFLNEEIFNAFNKDRAGTIAKAKKKWSAIRSVPAAKL